MKDKHFLSQKIFRKKDIFVPSIRIIPPLTVGAREVLLYFKYISSKKPFFMLGTAIHVHMNTSPPVACMTDMTDSLVSLTID